jgi:hypothetical protein
VKVCVPRSPKQLHSDKISLSSRHEERRDASARVAWIDLLTRFHQETHNLELFILRRTMQRRISSVVRLTVQALCRVLSSFKALAELVVVLS